MNSISSKFVVIGGKALSGSVFVSGAKNSATKLFIASLLTDEKVILKNCPCGISELKIAKNICESLGTKIDKFSDNEVILQTKKIKSNTFSERLGIVNRIGILTAGPVLSRIGNAVIPKLGGDKIGTRPLNFHFDALKSFGVTIKEYKNFYDLKAKKLQGTTIKLPFPSVGATENIILTGCLAEGNTVIINAAVEPEIIDLILYLQKMGAIIDVMTDRKIVIKGVDKLHSVNHTVMPDRLEAASLACAAIASKGEVHIKNARQIDMISFLNSLRLIGADYEILKEGILFKYTKPLKSIAIETNVHPGFMTDWQPPFTILLTQAIGISIIHETVYENRFGYVDQLNKMGADIELHNNCLGSTPCRFNNTNYKHSAVIKGPTKLSPSTIGIPDIRAGFSYLVAAIIAKGKTVVNGASYIDRGYERIDKKLRSLGVDIERID